MSEEVYALLEGNWLLTGTLVDEAGGMAASTVDDEAGVAALTVEEEGMADEVTVALVKTVEVMTLGAVKTVVDPALVMVWPTGQVVTVSETMS
jgi:hypothetical protein